MSQTAKEGGGVQSHLVYFISHSGVNDGTEPHLLCSISNYINLLKNGRINLVDTIMIYISPLSQCRMSVIITSLFIHLHNTHSTSTAITISHNTNRRMMRKESNSHRP